MNPEFEIRIRKLEPSLQRLLGATPRLLEAVPVKPPLRGIYVFFEDEKALYVGRSNNIGKRLRLHSRAGSLPGQASFASRLAKISIGLASTPYSIRRTDPAHWTRRPEFLTEFSSAKQRLRAMHVRYVEEADPVDQVLLEAYIATVLQTPHNDFDNH